MTALVALLAALVGAASAVGVLASLGMIRPRHPYRYVCPTDGCTFRCSATDMVVLDRFATRHEAIHR